MSVQLARLDEAKCSVRLRINTRLQNWFLVHHRNTFLLKQLIDLMKSENIKKGSPIRYIKDSGAFRITDLEKRCFEEVKEKLPDSHTELEKLIAETADVQKAPENLALNNLLNAYGITRSK